MCIPFMYEKSESFANLVMETSPNVVLIVDENMKIMEYSAVGEKIFRQNPVRGIENVSVTSLLIRWTSSGYLIPIRIFMEKRSAIRI